MARTPRENTDLWEDWFNSRTDEARNAIVVLYLDQADRQAKRKAKATPGAVTVDDLRSAAHVGLIKAVETYDPSTGVPEGAYISQRIEFAMLDWLRHVDFVPRRSGGEYPLAVTFDPGSIDRGHTTDDAEVVDGWSGCGSELDEWVIRLDEDEQLVISMHYRMGLTLDVVAAAMGRSRESVSLLHRRAIFRLKRMAAGLE